MQNPDLPFEEAQKELNPHREADQKRATESIAGWLVERDIELTGDETDDQLVTLLDVVEGFERAVAARGGDSMTNALDSADPDFDAYVLPRRRGDESADAYIERVRQAADALA